MLFLKQAAVIREKHTAALLASKPTRLETALGIPFQFLLPTTPLQQIMCLRCINEKEVILDRGKKKK